MSNYKEYWYQSDDGLRLFARDYSARCKEPDIKKSDAKPNQDQTTIICLHGLTRNSADYAPLCDRLCEKYPIYALDVRGRGQSDYDSNPMNYHVFTYMNDVKTFINQLGLKSVILIGTSMGGFISMVLAADSPDLIKGVVLNDIGPEVNAEGIARIMEYISEPNAVSSWESAVVETKLLNDGIYPDFDERDWLRFTKNLYRANALGVPELDYDKHIVDAFQQASKNTNLGDFWPVFSQIMSIPFLVVRGAMSDILDMPCVNRMQDEHPDLSYLEISYRGHTPLLNEKECEPVLDSFLEKCSQQG